MRKVIIPAAIAAAVVIIWIIATNWAPTESAEVRALAAGLEQRLDSAIDTMESTSMDPEVRQTSSSDQDSLLKTTGKKFPRTERSALRP